MILNRDFEDTAKKYQSKAINKLKTKHEASEKSLNEIQNRFLVGKKKNIKIYFWMKYFNG